MRRRPRRGPVRGARPPASGAPPRARQFHPPRRCRERERPRARDRRPACRVRREPLPPPAHGVAASPSGSTISGGQVLPDDAANPIRPEVTPRHGARNYRFENCGALRALCRPAFLRSTMRASRVRKPCRLSEMRSSGSASTRARATPCRTAPGLARDPAAMHPDTKVVGAFRTRHLERGENHAPVSRPREVLLQRAAVDPALAVSGPQDHACDRRLPLARAPVLRDRAHGSSRGFGACATCG